MKKNLIGYSVKEVEDTIDALKDENKKIVDDLKKEINRLKERNESLEKEIAVYREKEQSIVDAIVFAEKNARVIVGTAGQKKDELLLRTDALAAFLRELYKKQKEYMEYLSKETEYLCSITGDTDAIVNEVMASKLKSLLGNMPGVSRTVEVEAPVEGGLKFSSELDDLINETGVLDDDTGKSAAEPEELTNGELNARQLMKGLIKGGQDR